MKEESRIFVNDSDTTDVSYFMSYPQGLMMTARAGSLVGHRSSAEGVAQSEQHCRFAHRMFVDGTEEGGKDILREEFKLMLNF